MLAGLTGGFAMASLAGARRTDTALARLRAETNAADAVVFSSQVGATHPDWAPLRAQSEIKDVAVWDLVFGNLAGDPNGLLFAPDDEQDLQSIAKPVVVSGRLWSPDATDEIVIDENTTKASEANCKQAPPTSCSIRIGSTIDFQPFGADQQDSAFGGAAEGPHGPKIMLKVVGVVRTINQFLFVPNGQAFLSPAFVKANRDKVLLLENADVQLRNGAADMPALQRDMNALVAPGAPVLDLHAVSRRVDTTLSVERTALLLLALVVAIAGGLLVAQALVRSAGTIGDDALVLRAFGMTRAQLVGATVAVHVVTAGVAAAVGVVGAVVGSQWLPVGLGRRIDPDVGVHADLTVLLPGMLLIAALVLVGAGLVAWRASRVLGAVPFARRASFVEAIRRRTPVSVGIGTSMAFERGRGRRSVPVGPALIGAIVGVVGVVGTLTIDRGISDSLSHPERAGVTWDATGVTQPAAYRPGSLDPAVVGQVVAAAPAGTAMSIVDRQVIDVGGVGVPTFAIRDNGQGKPNVGLALTSGRAPGSDGEAAIGPATARNLHLGIGDTVTVGDAHTVVRITGYALFPSDVHAEFDEGLWLTPRTLDTTSPPPATVDDFTADRILALRFPKGTDVDGTIASMGTALGDAVSISPAEPPVELENLRNVRTLPIILAGFLALLALAAVSHVLLTSSRRRRRDFAILRAIGFNRRGTRLVLNAQGTAIGIVGILVGLPLGLAVGRVGWRWVADRVPLEEVPPLALLALVVVVPATVLLVNALALWPGRIVARLRPAELLRSE